MPAKLSRFNTFFALLILFSIPSTAFSDEKIVENPVQAIASFSGDTVAPGSQTQLQIKLEVVDDHKAYVDNLNKAVKEAKLEKIKLEDLMKDVSKYPVAVRNNGGGHYNHSLFWKLMTPAGGGEPTGQVLQAINTSFGSFGAMKEKFNAAATSRFGSGWAWLVLKDGKLEIGSTANQDNPLMDVSELKGKPILALDVWEHAYYLKYQNKRADYVNAFWSVVNWGEVSKLLGE